MASPLGRALDTLLDQAILFSYSRIGYALRRRSWSLAELDVDMTGKTCLVTGANSGLGRAAAERLASLGATVYMLARNRDRGQVARHEIVARTGNENVHLELADLSSLVAVRGFVSRFLDTVNRLDVLVNNAGVLLPERQVSVDGIEMTFATNILGPFLLTNLLVPRIERSAPARIINVSSGGMYTQKLDVADLQFERKPFDGLVAYAQTKRAQVILTELWAERLAGTGVTVNAMHPGWADTPGVQRSLLRFYRLTKSILRTAEQGADTIVWLAVAPQLASESGKFWFDRQTRGTHKARRTKSSAQERQQLWAACVRLGGWAADAESSINLTKP